MMKTGLTEYDFEQAAALLGCEVAAIKAVAEVESRSTGFLPTGEPVILFERHIFYQFTNARFATSHPDLCNKQPGGYGKEMEQHAKLARAVQLNRRAALMSASWGRFQVMGFNYRLAGYNHLQSFINAAYNSEADHLRMFVHLVINTGLASHLVHHNWTLFATGYNGTGYRKNDYDKKMEAAYRKYRR